LPAATLRCVAVATEFDFMTRSRHTILLARVGFLFSNNDVMAVVGGVSGLLWVVGVCARLTVVIVLNMNPGGSKCELIFDCLCWRLVE